MTAPSLLIWDFDGTLVDSRQAVAQAQRRAMLSQGFPPPSPEQGIALIGLPLARIFPALVGRALAEDQLQALIDAYVLAYLDLAPRLEQVYPGIPELLTAAGVAGRTQAIATGKSTRGAHNGAARNGLSQHFAVLYGFDAVPDPKPGPGLVHRILAELEATPDDAVVIGDTEFDVEMGRRAGVRTVGVTWGAHPAERLATADHLVHDVAQLAALLRLA